MNKYFNKSLFGGILAAFMLFSHSAYADSQMVTSELRESILKVQSKIEEMPIARKSSNYKSKKITYISNKDVGSTGLVISKPGVYELTEDIDFHPKKSPKAGDVYAAITIASSNVTLLLKHFHLYQHVPNNPKDQIPFCIGILVPDVAPTNTDNNYIGLESIYIIGKEASISNFSMYGIRVFGHVADVQISNLTVKNSGNLASLINRPFPNYFPKSSNVTNYGPAFGVAGISIGESEILGMGPTFFTQNIGVTQNRVQSVVLENVTCLNNFYNGICMANTTDVAINNCHFDGTFSDDPGNANGPYGLYQFLAPTGANFAGSDTQVEDPNIFNMVVNNTTFNNTTFDGDYTTAPVQDATVGRFTCVGCTEVKSRNVIYNNCQFNGTTNLFAPIAALTGGFTVGYLSGANEDTTFYNCSFDETKSLGGINAFHRSGSSPTTYKSSRNLHLINCTANNSQNIGDQQLPTPTILTDTFHAGFAIYYAKDVTLDSCIAQDLIVTGPLDASGSASGFYLSALAFQVTPDANVANIILRNCIASRIYTYNGGVANGFEVEAPTLVGAPPNSFKSVVFENCIATDASTFPPTFVNPSVIQNVGCGFFVLQATQNSPEEFRSWPGSFTGCKALHNKGVPTFFNAFYSAGYFIQGAQRHTFYDCEASDNVYGFLLQNCDQSVIRQCRADNNMDLNYIPGTGEGFTDLGATGTPAAPTASTNLFEANHAFANGSGTLHVGTNGNYNVVYGGLFPVLEGSISGTFPNSPNFLPSHNISIIE